MRLKIDIGQIRHGKIYEIYRSIVNYKTMLKVLLICFTRKFDNKKWDLVLIRGEFLKKFFYVWISPCKKLEIFCSLKEKGGLVYPAFSVGYFAAGIKNI